MPNLPELIYEGTGAAALLYTGTVTAAALTALLARTPARRRAAREVLTILLPHRDRPNR